MNVENFTNVPSLILVRSRYHTISAGGLELRTKHVSCNSEFSGTGTTDLLTRSIIPMDAGGAEIRAKTIPTLKYEIYLH